MDPSPSTNTTPEVEEHVPRKAKVAYGITYLGNNLLSGLGLGTIDVFYMKATGIDPSMMALSWIIFAIWNAINDPIIGVIQDRTKSDKGRRIPYLRYGSFFYVIAFLLIWFPFSSDPWLLFWNHLLMLFIFDTLYSMIGIITYSMPAEMAVTAKERGSIILYSTFLGAIGVVSAIVLPIIFLGDAPNILGFRIMMIICGIVALVTIYFSSFHIQENQYTQLEEAYGFIDSIKMTLKNKAFIILEFTIFALVVLQNALVGYIIFIMDYVLDFDLTKIENLLMVGIFAGALGYFILKVTRMIETYGLRKLNIIGDSVGALGFVVLLVIGLALQPTASNKIPLTIGIIPLALILFGLIIYMLTGQPLMADVIDNDELLTGKRREASYSGVNALITKPAVSIGHAIFLVIVKYYGYISTVDPTTGLPPAPVDQPASVAMGVVLAFTIVPIICLIIAIFAMRYFPLDGPEWRQKKRMIHEIHIKKQKDYEEYLLKKKNTPNSSK